MAQDEAFNEAPETPAPVFAVRAFKHALFGTPKVDTRDRFDDIATAMISKTEEVKSEDGVDPPKDRYDDIKTMALPDVLGFSPTKPNGILMTPGTTRRNKTVTFGAQVVDNEGKKISRSGLPNTCPGKFPSPWTPKTDVNSLSETSSSSQKRTKLTQTLHDVRDSSRTRGTSDRQQIKSKDDLDITLDFMEPRSQSGKYWKQEYDAYAEKTQREVRKLLLKKKAAKDFAKDKDAELVQLTDKLRQETRRAEGLEARTKELEKQMTDLKRELDADKLVSAPNEAARLRLENWKLREDLERVQPKAQSAQSSPRKRPLPAANADIWADAMHSSPFVVDAAEKSPERTVKLATAYDQSPLGSRDINTLHTRQPRSHSKSKGRTADLTPKRKPAKSTPRSSRDSQILPDDTIDFSLALPQPSPEIVHRTTPRSTGRAPRSARRSVAEKTVDELLERYSPTKSIIMSSPPPKFDRLAMPIGMPSAKSNVSHTQQPVHRSKPSLAQSFAKAASPRAVTATDDAVAAPAPLVSREKVDRPVPQDMDDGKSQKKKISEEKRQAALQRIAARRAEKAKAC